MHVLDAALVTADDVRVPVARPALVHQGWGVTGLVSLAARPPSGWPIHLDLSWYSLMEDRFYSEQFDLPHARICTLAAAGLPRPAGSAPAACNTLLVGMAPGGRVALWIAGGGLARQVCLATGGEADIDWAATAMAENLSRDAYRRAHLDRVIGEQHEPLADAAAAATHRWDRRNRRHRWRPMLTSDVEGATLRITAFNGDREHLDVAAPGPAKPTESVPERGLPRALALQWTDPHIGPLVACVDIDEAEIFAAFDKLGNAHPGQALVLHLEPTSDQELRLYLCDAGHSLELLVAQVTVYQDPR